MSMSRSAIWSRLGLRVGAHREAGRHSKRWSRARLFAAASALGGASLAFPMLTKVPDPTLQLPRVYSAKQVEEFFKARPLEVAARTWEILAAVVPYLARFLVWEHLIRRKIKHHEGLQKKYAVELRELLTSLGPCFIKLGQAVSIRPDLLPSSFLFELQKLCDAVPSFPTSDAVAVIEAELGRPVGEVFEGLEGSEPIAAASLGQVYKVRLVETDQMVAVKVQRPDMQQAVLRDIHIIRRLSVAIQWFKTTFSKQRPYDVALVDTFGTATLQELDYIHEAANQARCKDELEPKMDGKIYIPSVWHELTTRKVLVTEWIEGPQLAKSSSEVIQRLTPVGIECFLTQLLETGFFHADPHPGNLLVTQDGKLAIIDFGLMAEVPVGDTRTMTMTIVHLMQGDVGGLVDDAVQLGFLPKDVDRETLVPVLQRVFDSAQLAVTDQVRAGLQFQAIQSRRKQFWAVSMDLNRIFYLYPFLVPDYFALITRAMIVLEGIAITGDPSFDLFRSAYPYSLRRAVSVFGYRGVAELAREATKLLGEMGLPKGTLAELGGPLPLPA